MARKEKMIGQYFNEKRDEEVCPDNPAAQCCYDEKGDLVDSEHKYAGCAGTSDEYRCVSWSKSFTDCLAHTLWDSGGVVDIKNFKSKGVTSHLESLGYYNDKDNGGFSMPIAP